MPFSPDREREIARRLCGDKINSVTPVQAGGNNRLFYVATVGGQQYVLKSYLQDQSDSRERLRVEVDALTFLRGQGVSCVPAVIGHDVLAGFALFERMEGEPVGEPADADLEASLRFVRLLKDLTEKEEAQLLPLASEACLSGAELIRQVRARSEALQVPAQGHAALSDYLNVSFLPVLDAVIEKTEAGFAKLNWDITQEISDAQRTLSPSDFGFHNALKVANGRLTFVDFEYFGWDDPVKLTADFLLHPAMSLDSRKLEHFQQCAADIFAEDSAYPERLRLLYPLYALRWCMIVLNEFLPERWARRQFASAEMSREQVQERQLQKAAVCLEKTRMGLG